MKSFRFINFLPLVILSFCISCGGDSASKLCDHLDECGFLDDSTGGFFKDIDECNEFYDQVFKDADDTCENAAEVKNAYNDSLDCLSEAKCLDIEKYNTDECDKMIDVYKAIRDKNDCNIGDD